MYLEFCPFVRVAEFHPSSSQLNEKVKFKGPFLFKSVLEKSTLDANQEVLDQEHHSAQDKYNNEVYVISPS